jgi:2',3'-cyclic-nucleotide 2'-phosphodiesterase/3'-nucleotidase
MSMADGSQFDEAETYSVAVTSYRANGGGSHLKEGAGLDAEEAAARITARYPEIRELLYDFILEHKTINEEIISRNHLIGNWKFVPENLAQEALSNDMTLLLGVK